jgi:hypothetical protein
VRPDWLDGIDLNRLSEYERNRVIRMTPAQRGRYREYGRVNERQKHLDAMLETHLITQRQYNEMFENEVVSVRRRLHLEDAADFNEFGWTPEPREAVNWREEGF